MSQPPRPVSARQPQTNGFCVLAVDFVLLQCWLPSPADLPSHVAVLNLGLCASGLRSGHLVEAGQVHAIRVEVPQDACSPALPSREWLAVDITNTRPRACSRESLFFPLQLLVIECTSSK